MRQQEQRTVYTRMHTQTVLASRRKNATSNLLDDKSYRKIERVRVRDRQNISSRYGEILNYTYVMSAVRMARRRRSGCAETRRVSKPRARWPCVYIIT